MIYGKINGGLGNCLFVIAAGATLAAKNNTQFQAVFEEREGFEHDSKGLEVYFNQFKNNVFRNIFVQKGFPEKCKLYKEETFTYQPIPYSDDFLLDGLFFSYKYFDENLIRSLFRIDETTQQQITDLVGNKFKDATCINVRRGDYLKLPLFLPVCSVRYYKKAIKRIGKKSLFIITSDDINWCKKNFKGDNFIFVENTTPAIDFYIQTLSKNNIISNGSFGWWGAYLNANPEKKVIIPTPWFGKAMNYDTQDFIPADWIQINNLPTMKVRLANLKYESSTAIRNNFVLSRIYNSIKRVLKN